MKDAQETNLPIYRVTVLCFFFFWLLQTLRHMIDGICGVAKPFQGLKEKQ